MPKTLNEFKLTEIFFFSVLPPNLDLNPQTMDYRSCTIHVSPKLAWAGVYAAVLELHNTV